MRVRGNRQKALGMRFVCLHIIILPWLRVKSGMRSVSKAVELSHMRPEDDNASSHTSQVDGDRASRTWLIAMTCSVFVWLAYLWASSVNKRPASKISVSNTRRAEIDTEERR